MYVVIVGCGKVGHHLTKALMAIGHEVTAIDRSEHRCRQIANGMGSVILQGDGTSLDMLNKAGVSRADLVIAVTDSDEANLAVCQMAKTRFEVSRTISLIKNPSHEALFRILGVDVVINTTHLILSTIEEEIPGRPLVHLMNLQGHNMDIVTLVIPDDADVVGKRIEEIDMPPNSFVSLVVKSTGPTLPTNDLIIDSKDDVVVVTVPDEEQALHETFTGVG